MAFKMITQITKYLGTNVTPNSIYRKKQYHKAVSFLPVIYKFSVIPISIPAGQRAFIYRYLGIVICSFMVNALWYLPQV